MRLFYIFLSLLLFSCTVTPPKKPVAKKPHPDLKKDTIEAPIHTQTFINYSFVEDSLSGKTSQMKFDELTLTYDAEGKLLKKITSTYDKEGNETENIVYKGDGTIAQKKNYVYQYDKKRNWIKKTESENGELSLIIQQKFEYYK